MMMGDLTILFKAQQEKAEHWQHQIEAQLSKMEEGQHVNLQQLIEKVSSSTKKEDTYSLASSARTNNDDLLQKMETMMEASLSNLTTTLQQVKQDMNGMGPAIQTTFTTKLNHQEALLQGITLEVQNGRKASDASVKALTSATDDVKDLLEDLQDTADREGDRRKVESDRMEEQRVSCLLLANGIVIYLLPAVCLIWNKAGTPSTYLPHPQYWNSMLSYSCYCISVGLYRRETRHARHHQAGTIGAVGSMVRASRGSASTPTRTDRVSRGSHGHTGNSRATTTCADHRAGKLSALPIAAAVQSIYRSIKENENGLVTTLLLSYWYYLFIHLVLLILNCTTRMHRRNSNTCAKIWNNKKCPLSSDFPPTRRSWTRPMVNIKRSNTKNPRTRKNVPDWKSYLVN
jgi:hypothetical protein